MATCRKPIRPEELAAALTGTPKLVANQKPIAPSPATLDPIAIERLRDIASSPTSFGRLLQSFVTNGSALVDRLIDAVEAGDVEALMRNSHTLKSNAASFGATALAELCSSVESTSRAGSLDGATDLVPRIADAFETAIEALEALP